MTPTLLTLQEVAHELRCSKATVSKLTRGLIAKTPTLPVVRVGRRVLIRRQDLLDWIFENASGTVVRAS